ncbi:MAG: lytic transglycosylase [Sulfobacillus thermosulfidooxidans]|uniref:transglycosylase SLT domain-containing protein n=1 Tax=Sulfobacillus sp. hq2 TaxID=2039167 RepID=UPI000CD23C0C|nr:transglycosylase SLT domain-containing protein [Sulfobacillus sp. hq2]MCY0908622.1 transglycosylase SLT domain-containing protein [Sulfobacillus thermotolerans]POB10293.1 lytic transglycosylase [Sulfobacillus sp. hq2]PSR35818.1 MAG: lytic transglycosylase [Sulfobacillus thermosulfidooxidans]
MRGKTALALIGASLMVLSGPVMAYAASLQQLQQEEAQAQSQLAQEQSQYAQTQAAINQAAAQISSLNQKLAQAQNQIGSTNQQLAVTNAQMQKTAALLASTQAQLSATENELNATQANYQKTKALVAQTQNSLIQESKLLSGQLQLIEERGSIGYLDVLLGANSFNDFVSRLDLLGQVAGQAASEVNVIKAEEAQETKEKESLKAEAQLLSAAQASLSAHQSLLQQERNLLASQESQALALHNQAVSDAQSAASTIAVRRQTETQLQNQQQQLSQNMAALGNRISEIASQIQSLLSQFNQGNLSQRALYNAMLPLVTPIAQQENLPPALVIAVITEESGGNANAVSSAGAIGLMQLEPGTAAVLGISPSELYNPEENLLAGCLYLREMLNMFGGNLSVALSAYNAGPGAVQAGGDRVLPYTVGYVDNIESLYAMYSQW